MSEGPPRRPQTSSIGTWAAGSVCGMQGPEDGARAPPAEIAIPQAFRDMPRWWSEGSGWLETLPGLVRSYCSRWQLTVTGEMAHGSNAAVVPVARTDERFVLRLTPPGPGVAEQVDALRFWNGRGTVRLIDADVAGGVMLLERLALGASVRDVPVAEAMPILGRMMRRLDYWLWGLAAGLTEDPERCRRLTAAFDRMCA